jgi:O-antigen ligase
MNKLSLKKSLLQYFTNDCRNKDTLISFFSFLLRFGFCFYILFFPIGKAPANIGSICAMIGLLGTYALDYQNSNLKLLGKLKWIYFIFIGFILFKAFHNINISNGWYGFRTNVNGAFTLFLIGLEFIRNKRDLKIVIALFTIAGFYEGLDGIYQYIVGVDFIRGDPPLSGPTGIRLTGSMKTYRVGNYMSLILPISLGAWALFPSTWSRWKKAIFMAIILFPGMFLFLGAQTRSGFLGFFVAAVALYALLRGFTWKILAGGAALLSWALFFGSKRTSFEMVLQDGRIQELWPYALKVFQSAPLLGVGLNSYNPGVHALGLEFQRHSQSIQHPHNIYLQFLCEMGIIGLLVLVCFFGTYLIWSLRHTIKGFVTNEKRAPWIMLSFFWAAFLGYTATGLSGHDFFRPWWLGTAFSILGIVMGGCLTLSGETKPAKDRN